MTEKAAVGDKIKFKREKNEFSGEVVEVRENSVIVHMGENSKGEPMKTIVNHKNYKITQNMKKS